LIELDSGRIHVRRAKNGVDSTHPLTGKEIRAFRQLRRENHGRYARRPAWTSNQSVAQSQPQDTNAAIHVKCIK